MAEPTVPQGASRTGAPSRKAPRGSSQPVAPHTPVSDITIARAIGAEVRTTPHVVDLSPGLFALAATYGPHERFVGVAVRHFGLHDTAVDVHVTVAMEATPTANAQDHLSSLEAPTEPPESAVLTHVAIQIREAVYRAMRALHLDPPSTVDVFIDDIQVGA